MNFYHLDDIPEDLRSYFEPAPQLGLEKTPEEYVAKVVEGFREVRRVLRDDGTLWLNLGDSYAGDSGCHSGGSDKQKSNGGGLKPKDLVGIPWRVAFALQADGWYLRQDIIWHKPSCMPESVTDRCTKNHEYIFLLSKSERYYYDCEAIKEPCSDSFLNDSRWETGPTDENEKDGYASAMAQNPKSVHRLFKRNSAKRGEFNGKTQSMPGRDAFRAIRETRNKRSVWTVTIKGYKDAHFATYPPNLIKPCILAGCPIGGTVLDPFGGSGTTGMVALELGRKAVLVELNPEYVKLAEKRCHVTPGLPI